MSEQAIHRLRRALDEHDSYGPVPNDTPLMLDFRNCAYELVDPGRLNVRLTLGDLRDILQDHDFR